MKKMILILLTLLSLVGCAGQTPLQQGANALDNLKNNMLSDALLADANATLADVEIWKGQIPDTDYLAAKSCAEYIIAAHPEKEAIVSEVQAAMIDLNEEITGIATGVQSPMLIRKLTAAKYGPQGAKGADPKGRLETLEKRAVKLVSGARNACMNLFDDQLLIDLGKRMVGL